VNEIRSYKRREITKNAWGGGGQGGEEHMCADSKRGRFAFFTFLFYLRFVSKMEIYSTCPKTMNHLLTWLMAMATDNISSSPINCRGV
jgi:hypothetical protein